MPIRIDLHLAIESTETELSQAVRRLQERFLLNRPQWHLEGTLQCSSEDVALRPVPLKQRFSIVLLEIV